MYWEGTTKLLDEKRVEFFQQIVPGNVFLAACTKGRRGPNIPTITGTLSDSHLLDPFALFFPLYTYGSADLFGNPGKSPNISPGLLDRLIDVYDAASEQREAIAVALFYHILGVTRAPLYSTENEGYLMQDWPRIPIPASRELLEASAALGRRVADLLRPDVPFHPPGELNKLGVPRRVDGGQLREDDLRVTVRYGGIGKYEPPSAEGPGARPGRLWWNDVAFWENVPQDVWAFTIGGYPVVKKWLDYRHIDKLKRPLKLEEVRYVGEMVQRIAALIALGPELDASYEAIKAHTLSLAPSAVVAHS